jgi:hypothetical protein
MEGPCRVGWVAAPRDQDRWDAREIGCVLQVSRVVQVVREYRATQPTRPVEPVHPIQPLQLAELSGGAAVEALLSEQLVVQPVDSLRCEISRDGYRGSATSCSDLHRVSSTIYGVIGPRR